MRNVIYIFMTRKIILLTIKGRLSTIVSEYEYFINVDVNCEEIVPGCQGRVEEGDGYQEREVEGLHLKSYHLYWL